MRALSNLAWRVVAGIAPRPHVFRWLLMRAVRTPYTPITSQDGTQIYMQRWWLFNPYEHGADGDATPARWPWLPSLRMHHIRVPDTDRHLHDHPWNARTIVLAGWYDEVRTFAALTNREALSPDGIRQTSEGTLALFHRRSGYTGRLLYAQYHRIAQVSEGGVFTLFITWRKRGEWGFAVDGQKVPWRQYIAEREAQTPAAQSAAPVTVHLQPETSAS
jgi:hypothetical protein